jgi:hypothetical protein
MAGVILVTRLGLSAVFIVAGLAKLRDLDASRQAVLDFGLPRRSARVLGTLVPLAELAAGAALIPHFSSVWGAVAACVLLLAFTAAIAANLVRGRAPECRCFGQVHSAPVSWRMVGRNAALLAGAIAIIAGEAPVAIGAGVALAVILLLRRPPAEGEGLPVGTAAPSFDGLPALLERGMPVVLVFASRNCGPCLELAPELDAWREVHAERLSIEVLEREDEGVEAIFEAYRMDATPTAILVERDGRVASAVAPGADAIRGLVAGEPVEPHAGMHRRAFLVRVAGAAASFASLLLLPTRALAAVRAATPCTDPAKRSQGLPDDCGRGCTNLLTDPFNCSECGHRCGPEAVCAGGKCIAGDTPTGGCYDFIDPDDPGRSQKIKVLCAGQPGCIDLGRDVKNCGGCGSKCAGVRPVCCGGVCHDAASDAQHCGACWNSCPKDKPFCAGGKCVAKCPSGLAPCGSRCANMKTQRCCGGKLYDRDAYPTELCCQGKLVKPKTCGGKPICPQFNCCKGKAVNPDYGCGARCKECMPPGWHIPGVKCCGGECVNTGVNRDHCGGCFNKCGPGELCLRTGCGKGAR